ncbi:hypothetical protein D3C80_994250 [compost metagenome]
MKKIYLLIFVCLSVIGCSKEKEALVEKEKTKHFVQYYVENKLFNYGDSVKYYYKNQEKGYSQEHLPAKRTWSYSLYAYSGDTVYCNAIRSNFKYSSLTIYLLIDHKEVSAIPSPQSDRGVPYVYAVLP